MIKTQTVTYEDSGVLLEGYAASLTEEKRPVILLCHSWSGRDSFICELADQMASWNYLAFALDVYGKGIQGRSKSENAALKAPFIADRALLQRRLLKGYEVACALPGADPNRLAAFGVGFGGLSALDLARSGCPLKGAVSVYGFLDAPPFPLKSIHTHILLFHGFCDPIVTQKDLILFEEEMKKVRADWQLHLFGNAAHGFLNPQANDPESGILFHPQAANTTLRLTKLFFEEIFLEKP